jgi:hypothetical protein
MKKLLLLPVLFFLATPGKAQIVFCPQGATWHYEYTIGIFSPATSNETIIYTGDSNVGPDTLKKLVHRKFYLFCNYNTNLITLIKQKGDTIFFSNPKTQNTWQILYNFAAQAGQSWQTKIYQDNNNPVTHMYTVDSVGTVQINGFNLKRLYINNGKIVITERLGDSKFLFNYNNSGIGNCDGDYFLFPLCYTDAGFGTIQFSNRPCDFANLTGIPTIAGNSNKLTTFPTPFTDKLIVSSDANTLNPSYQISVISILGEKINTDAKKINENGDLELDLHGLKNGIYFLEISDQNKIIATRKIIKD